MDIRWPRCDRRRSKGSTPGLRGLLQRLTEPASRPIRSHRRDRHRNRCSGAGMGTRGCGSVRRPRPGVVSGVLHRAECLVAEEEADAVRKTRRLVPAARSAHQPARRAAGRPGRCDRPARGSGGGLQRRRRRGGGRGRRLAVGRRPTAGRRSQRRLIFILTRQSPLVNHTWPSSEADVPGHRRGSGVTRLWAELARLVRRECASWQNCDVARGRHCVPDTSAPWARTSHRRAAARLPG